MAWDMEELDAEGCGIFVFFSLGMALVLGLFLW